MFEISGDEINPLDKIISGYYTLDLMPQNICENKKKMTKKNAKKAKDESDGLATVEPDSQPAEDLFEEENSEKKKKKKKKKGKDDEQANEGVEQAEELDEDQDDKKNKKAKKKEKVDPKKEKKGGPGKKALAAMQETLRKIRVK